MEDIVIALIRDLPSTGILVLFVWFVAKQFTQALDMLQSHLEQLNKLIEKCLASKDMEEKERVLDRKIARLDLMMKHAKDLGAES